MKQSLSLLLITFAGLLFSCSDDDNKNENFIADIILNKNQMNLVIGNNELLTATIKPVDAEGTIEWNSTDPTVATVNEGLVTALKEGRTIITASCQGYSKPCIVTVTPELPVEITGIRFAEEAISMNVKDSKALTIVVEPEEVQLTELIWTSDNERVVEVSPTGEIIAIGHGKTKVNVSYGEIVASCVITVAEPERKYKLFWFDEFDGDALDMTKWNHETGGGGWGNQELQYYTNNSENAFLQDGCLIIEAKRETYQNRNYTSARLTTKGKMDITYGKIEARIALPAGRGTWPAFWMMPSKSVFGGWPRSGEIDIMEHVGAETDMISHAVHTEARSGGTCWSHRTYYEEPLEEVFHTYTVEWINDYLNGNDAFIFYVDGVRIIIKDQSSWKTSTYRDWPFDQDFYVILNLAIGGSWGGYVDDNIFNTPLQMKVDYVRVYKLEED